MQAETRTAFEGGLNRRGFVKTAAMSAVAWAAVKPAGGQVVSGYRNALPFVADGQGAGLTSVEVAEAFRVDATTPAAVKAAVSPQSVASGDLQPNGIVLWTRIDPGQQGGATPNRISWQV